MHDADMAAIPNDFRKSVVSQFSFSSNKQKFGYGSYAHACGPYTRNYDMSTLTYDFTVVGYRLKEVTGNYFRFQSHPRLSPLIDTFSSVLSCQFLTAYKGVGVNSIA